MRFLLVGGSNTLVTYAVFIFLGLIIPPWMSYTFAFCIGIVWTLLGTSQFVFKSRLNIKTGLLFVGWYLFLYGIGQLTIGLIKPNNFVSLAITSFFILIFTTPLTFIGGRFLFGGNPKK